MRRLCFVVVFCAMGLIGLSLRADDAKESKPAAAADAPKDPHQAENKRTGEQVSADIEKAQDEIRGILTSPDSLVDPAKRKEAAPKMIPILKRMGPLFDELALADPSAKDDVAGVKIDLLMQRSLFGDADATELLKTIAKENGSQSVGAQAALQMVAYWNDPKDEAAQLKVLEEVEKTFKANPKTNALPSMLLTMSKTGAASKAVSEKAEDILLANTTNDAAKSAAAEIKARRNVGKPVELAGTGIDGTAFSTKNWKGKVILVDFWATWCKPCVAELPNVKRAYLDYHTKGLEVLGVSNDRSPDDLKGFLEMNKDIPWPQLFDPKENTKIEWNPLARDWGVERLPTMFLIDRKGILRSIDAGENYQKEIPKLLEEKTE